MKKVLMLGSSHSACYKGIDTGSLGLNLDIAANSDGNIYKNLCIESNGTLSLLDNAKEWDKKVWHNSLNACTANINDYDFLIMNIRWNYDLPQIIHGDNCDLIDYYINILNASLKRELIYERYFSAHGSKQTLNLLEKLVSITKFSREKILICPEPLSTFPLNQKSRPQAESINHKIKEILEIYIPELIAERTSTKFLLPNAQMLENGFFIHSRYYPFGEHCSNWNNMINNKSIVDRKHKSSSYAADLLSSNVHLFS